LKKTTKYLTVLIILTHFCTNGYSLQLSDQAEISLLTCSPGTELYSIFGHSAIRVWDPVSGIDYVYNYGVFDFNTPNFYMKFVKGKLLYQIDRTSFNFFVYGYIRENRSVYQQILILSKKEKEQIFSALETNYLPQNRYYLYDFFYNNCCTKIIDLLESQVKDKNYFLHLDNPANMTFRQNIAIYLSSKEWTKFGIDLVMGLPADKKMSVRESMFLPDNLMNNLNSNSSQLAGNIVTLFKGSNISPKRNITNPNRIMWIISIIIILTTLIIKSEETIIFIDKTIFLTTGLFGIFFLILWLGTDHESFKYNLNLLWAMPSNVVFAFRRKLKNNRMNKYYFLGYGIFLLFIIIFWKAIPQEFNKAAIPIILLLSFRSFVLFRQVEKPADAKKRND